MQKKKADRRAKLLDKSIRLVWDSLQSHLLYTHTKSSEGRRFHKKCVREYSQLLKYLSELY